MDIKTELSNFGLNKSEIAIYLYLLEQGVSSPPQIAKSTKIARTNSYHILLSLKERGLIEEQSKGKRKVYLAKDPGALLMAEEARKKALERVVPDLRALFGTQTNKPKIKFYDGIEQVKQIYLESLNSDGIFALGSTKQLQGLTDDFLKKYAVEIKKRGIVFKDILTKASKESAQVLTSEIGGIYESRYLPDKHKDVPTDMLIWDDKIALISLSEPVFGTVMLNKNITNTFKLVFNLLWDNLES